MRTTICLTVFLTLLLVPAHADEVLNDSWQRIHIGGSPTGFAHTVVRKIETKDGPRIDTATHTELKINRLGSVIEIISDQMTQETPEGKVLRIESRSKMSGQEQSTVYSFEGRRVKLATTVLGQTRESELEIAEGVLGPHEVERRTAALAGTTGKVVEVLSFMTDMGNAIRTTSTSRGMESVVLLDGKTADLTRIESTLEGVPMKSVTWVDARGAMVKNEVLMAGMKFETYRVESEEAAKRTPAEDSQPPTDVFAASLLAEPGPVPAPRHVQTAVIEMRSKTEEAELPEIESAAHTVIDGSPGVHRIHARRSEPPTWVTAPRPIIDPPAELAESLAPNSMIQSDAKEIRQIAEKVVGDEPDAWRAAQKLERWVYVNLTNKGFGVGLASALEVCRNREGDCTEHAVFLAALCRAAGIPARVVMGVEYIMGVWGGHAWNEVWIDGTWYALDATNGYGFTDPLHLPLVHMTLKDSGMAQEFTGLLAGLGKIDLDVVEVTLGGRRIQVNDPGLLQTEGRRRTNRVWGIAYSAPEGFAFDPPSRGGFSPRLMELKGRTTKGAECKIRISALDAPAIGAWDALMDPLRAEAGEARVAAVDGRPARRLTKAGTSGTIEYAAVLAGDAIFLLEMHHVEGDAERDAFEAFLASIDFDLRQPR